MKNRSMQTMLDLPANHHPYDSGKKMLSLNSHWEEVVWIEVLKTQLI